MTYKDDESKELRLGVDDDGDNSGDYVKLRDDCGCVEEEEAAEVETTSCGGWKWREGVVWKWVKIGLVLIVAGVLAVVFLKWVSPFFMDKEIIPIINWETTTFSTPVLAVLVVASLALFPTLLLPSTPSMWVAGMTFGYGYGFLLIFTGVAVGVSLPYFIGSLFYHKIQGWIERYPKNASILRAAGTGNWLHQFKAVTLIRISPFPYVLYNYCSVATNVKFGPYILGSLLGTLPDIFVSIYTGILIRTLADASDKQHSLSTPQIIINVIGFCITVITTIIITVYAKRKLKELQTEDEPLLR